VRWQHPVRGLVPPMQFIPLAEESGLIEPIGEWVLRTACAQAAAWQHSGLPALRMGINVSARQFHSPALESVVAQVLAEHGLAPGQLELEITESLSMKDPEETIRILAGFKALGIGIAIDDFGTGYSNLAYLRRFPVRRIKLDRAFIGELGSQSSSHVIVEAIVAMAHKLDLQVIAEGVETAGQRDQLLRYGCDELQGYWFSRPVDAAACGALLQKQCGFGRGSYEAGVRL
jgi:EAL domain-containing protein (putative c-di-GMP-specific phosphodiesterase class I)